MYFHNNCLEFTVQVNGHTLMATPLWPHPYGHALVATPLWPHPYGHALMATYIRKIFDFILEFLEEFTVQVIILSYGCGHTHMATPIWAKIIF